MATCVKSGEEKQYCICYAAAKENLNPSLSEPATLYSLPKRIFEPPNTFPSLSPSLPEHEHPLSGHLSPNSRYSAISWCTFGPLHESFTTLYNKPTMAGIKLQNTPQPNTNTRPSAPTASAPAAERSRKEASPPVAGVGPSSFIRTSTVTPTAITIAPQAL